MARSVSVLLVMLVVMLGAGTASGARARDKKAVAAFARSDYNTALQLYAQLYAETHEPTYLRNIGRCYQLLRDPEKAIDSFRQYLVQAKDISLAKSREIEGFIKEMEELKAKQAAERQAAEPAPTTATTPPSAPVVTPPVDPVVPPPPVTVTKPPVAPEPVAPKVVVVKPEPAPAPAPMSVRRKVGIASFATGAAAVVVGTIFGLLARSAYHASDDRCSANNVCDDPGLAARDQGFDRALVSTIAFAAGVAGIGAGVGLWLSTPATSESGTHAALGGATWTVRW